VGVVKGNWGRLEDCDRCRMRDSWRRSELREIASSACREGWVQQPVQAGASTGTNGGDEGSADSPSLLIIMDVGTEEES